MSKNVLINVYDKDGIVEFVKNLAEKFNFEITATDISKSYLTENLITTNDFNWQDNNFDMIVCNFYPFEKLVHKSMDEDEVMKNIDTQGLSLLQKAAKNFKQTLAVSSSKDYDKIIEALKNDVIDETFRKEFAEKALMTICKVNANIIKVLDHDKKFVTIIENKVQNLTYGENPYQKATLFGGETISYDILTGSPLSYNNFLDINLATAIAAEFYDVCAVAMTRHAMPCAVALGSTIHEAYQKALDCDPVSAFGGIAAFTKTIDIKLAKNLASMFFEVIVAPDFDENAVEMLAEKNLKLIKINTPLKEYKDFMTEDIKKTPFGTLVQEPNTAELVKDTFQIVSKKKPTTEIVEDMVFAWKIAKHTRSNSAIVVKNLKTVGISQGQSNRIDAIDIALDKACESTKDAILATDGSISTIDGINDAAQARIAGIIQPGGGLRNKEVIAAADKYELIMITTGLRQFKNQ